MTRFEYKVVPAPRRGDKARGVKGLEDRFALTLTTLMNQLGRDGWEYVRADTLPVEERHGLAGRITVTSQNMLVFRRLLPDTAPRVAPAEEAAEAPHRPAAPRVAVETPAEPEPLSAAAASQLASVHAMPETRGPRLVAPAGEEEGFLSGNRAPPLGPANAGAPSAGPAHARQVPSFTRKGKDEPPSAG
ncbi:DUF4177 domain-containing protein [Solirhodobacter olei]|uniref:DUF4177 domain-containing protein n=1 Tax=Solirhodobacter olei TaxID=2493082 RepID=UPI000FDAABAA|nr:DUF4177 domain-containing protein [Solirhodobacter olei]